MTTFFRVGVSLAFGLLTFAREAGAQLDQTGTDTREILLQLERIWNDAHLRGDAKVLGQLWDDDLTVIVPGMPVFDKNQSLGIWRTGRMKFSRYETSELNFNIQAEVSIVTGRLIRERMVQDKILREDWRFTKVYVKRAGRWRVLAWHASPVVTP